MIEGADPLKLPCLANAPSQISAGQCPMIEGADPLKLPCLANAPSQISKPSNIKRVA